MIIETTHESIERLIDTLYLSKRDMESVKDPQLNNPVFVLVANCRDHRMEIERRIMDYFAHRFGFDLTKKLTYDINQLPNISLFHFPNGVDISVIEYKK